MADRNRGLPLVGIIAALVVVIVAGASYIVRLRGENAALRAAATTSSEQQATGAAAARAVAGESMEARALTGSAREAFIAELRKEPGLTRDVWFAYSPGDAESLAYQRSIQDAFEEAGWTVRRSAPSTFPLRPKIYFLMADASPPPHVLTALAAFGAAGIEVSAGRDYRAFNAQKKQEDPKWRGFDMEEEQAYIVAVGRRPD